MTDERPETPPTSPPAPESGEAGGAEERSTEERGRPIATPADESFPLGIVPRTARVRLRITLDRFGTKWLLVLRSERIDAAGHWSAKKTFGIHAAEFGNVLEALTRAEGILK